MEKYRYSDEELKLLENSRFPFAIYQFIDNKVVTIVLSAVFLIWPDIKAQIRMRSTLKVWDFKNRTVNYDTF